jgi:Fe-S oxidoreductase
MKTRYATGRDQAAAAKPFLLLLHELVAGGRLPLGEVRKARAVFHDPCYLSKHEGITEEPREILSRIPGLETVEMAHHGKRSLCCGAGGGGFWLDTLKGERLAEIRLDEAVEAGADMLVTACPYCLAMFEASRESDSRYADLEILDIGELVLRSLEGSGRRRQANKPGM